MASESLWQCLYCHSGKYFDCSIGYRRTGGTHALALGPRLKGSVPIHFLLPSKMAPGRRNGRKAM